MNELLTLKSQFCQHHIKIVQVVAFDNQYAIGKNNQLAWHIPEDLQHFKEITANGVVLMGRKTFLSIGRALPNRINWVITRDTEWTHDGVKVAHSLSDGLLSALADVKNSQNNALFIIGGGEIFAQTLPIADELEVTRIDLTVDGDAFYPAIGDEFVLTKSVDGISQKTGTPFVFCTYVRKVSDCQ